MAQGRHACNLEVALMRFFKKQPADLASLEEEYSHVMDLYNSDSLDEAFQNARPLAKKGHPESQLLLAYMYEEGLGTMQDSASALKWYTLCPLPEARYRQGRILIEDKGVLKDAGKGLCAYKEAAEAGYPPAVIAYGKMLEKGDMVQRNPAEAARLYRIGADDGDAECQYLLGHAYSEGIGVVQSQETAAELYLSSAKKGFVESMFNTGECYYYGTGLPKDAAKAEQWYGKAAGLGHVRSQCQMGILCLSGAGRENEAARWFRQAAEQGDGAAMNGLGVLYENGRGVNQSDNEAAAWYRRAEDAENGYGGFNLGRCCAEGIGVPANDTEAVRHLLVSADRGNLCAMLYLSEMVNDGRGAKQDPRVAREWRNRATTSMNSRTQFSIGWQYEHGVQVPVSDEEAVRWYRLAAGNGNSNAQCNLGVMYENGKGVERSETEAFSWYMKAAGNRNPAAQYNVGLMFDKGRGTNQSDEEAVRYYTRSAQNGSASAQCALGTMYEFGRGVEQSSEEAYRLYTLAMENGNPDAEKHLRRLLGEDDDEEATEMEPPVKTEEVKITQETFSKFKPVADTGIDFSMVKGLDDVKEEINNQILQPYQHPEVYKRFKKKVGGGILLYGPPGTGKTMIAQAIATETKAVFFSVKCSDILSRWTGEAVANIKKLFTLARKQPRAVIFFDEFEALGRARTDDSRSWEDSLMAELLSQIQGFDQYDSTLIILAATNRPWDIDNALLRSGRFSRHVYVPLPDDGSRRAIIEAQLEGVPVDASFDIGDAVDYTRGFNGADVVEYCEQMKQSAINRSIRTSSDDEKISKEDSEFAKGRTKCSVSEENTRRLEEFKRSGF